MSSRPRLPVVLCWHMHQPDYRDPVDGSFLLPWVYLHGIKDYTDMAFHIEQNAEARAVVNFAPVLLDQLDDYVEQIGAWFAHGTAPRDPLLAALAGPELSDEPSARAALVQACTRVNEAQMVARHPRLKELLGVVRALRKIDGHGAYVGDQLLADLLVWYHLAWLGESVRESESVVAELIAKGHRFTADDRRGLVRVICEALAGLKPRYRALAEAGRIELSVTPQAHPILPLLLDFASASEAMPEAPLPHAAGYPGGEERAAWHVRHALASFEHHFGFPPTGCWPAEGAICSRSAALLGDAGFRWIASGQQVLRNSLAGMDGATPLPEHWMHRVYRVSDSGLAAFFRDDGLSDLIGFTYASWHADDAVGNLIGHLEQIAQETAHRSDTVVSIIMDGENAWESYPCNGSFFLGALYERLAEHPSLDMCTFSSCLDSTDGRRTGIEHLVPGSWVYGTLSTWIGEDDKNRAWDMLAEAKLACDRVLADDGLATDHRRRIERQLGVCEGSDWFWWFGDYNPADAVSDFEQLFRRQLIRLYALIDQKPPGYLHVPFTSGSGSPALGGVMRHSRG